MSFATDTDKTNDSSTRGQIKIDIERADSDPANNRTDITWKAVVSDGNASSGGYNFNNPSGTGAFSNGNITAGSGGTASGNTDYSTGYRSYDFGSGEVSNPYFPRTLGSYYATITHSTTTGTASVRATAGIQGNGNPLGKANVSTGFVSLTTFTGPTTPAAPTVTRAVPSTINITSQIPSSAGSLAIQRYEYRYSTNSGSTWSAAISMGGSGTYPSITPTRTANLSATATTQYYIQTRALSNYDTTWGVGAWSTSTIINGIPTAPSSITLTRTGKNVLVVSGSATGIGITGYYVQSSSDGGSNWSVAQLMTSQQYNYTTLTSGLTYIFRVYATNSIGNSAYRTSSSLFVAGYGYKRASDNTWTAIQSSKIYVGLDGIGADANGWRTIQNAKRYVSDTGSGSPGWIDLTT
jgi:hypothetical protein